MDNLIFLDTETTGTEDPRVCQVAFYAPTTDGVVRIEHANFKPTKTIEIGAMATHHITNEMVAGCDPFAGSLFATLLSDHLTKRIVVAHNAPFDIGVLHNEGLKVNWYIDTLRVARHILPNRESHALQWLRYDLKLDLKKYIQNFDVTAHDAASDVLVLFALFKHLQTVLADYYQKATYKDQILEMVRLTNTPVMLEICPMKKHKGKKWVDVAAEDPDYIKWLWNAESAKTKEEQSEDLIYTLTKLMK